MIRLLVLALFLSMMSCRDVVEWQPHRLSDTSDVSITCDGTQGNKRLMGYKDKVYVYTGVITDASDSPYVWRYIKFDWYTTDSMALAQPAGDNKWVYKIHNIRKFFGVPDDEEILQVAILFLSKERGPTQSVLRNSNGSDLLVPVSYNTTTPDQ